VGYRYTDIRLTRIGTQLDGSGAETGGRGRDRPCGGLQGSKNSNFAAVPLGGSWWVRLRMRLLAPQNMYTVLHVMVSPIPPDDTLATKTIFGPF
jgi:hypothetical protein